MLLNDSISEIRWQVVHVKLRFIQFSRKIDTFSGTDEFAPNQTRIVVKALVEEGINKCGGGRYIFFIGVNINIII